MMRGCGGRGEDVVREWRGGSRWGFGGWRSWSWVDDDGERFGNCCWKLRWWCSDDDGLGSRSRDRWLCWFHNDRCRPWGSRRRRRSPPTTLSLLHLLWPVLHLLLRLLYHSLLLNLLLLLHLNARNFHHLRFLILLRSPHTLPTQLWSHNRIRNPLNPIRFCQDCRRS